MRHCLPFVLPAALIFITACAHDRPPETSGGRSAPHAAKPMEADEEYHLKPRTDTVPDIMQAKLAHAQALMEGIAIGDFAQIEANAQELHRISSAADFLAHDTVSYYAFCDQFRASAKAIIEHARARDLDAVASDFSGMTTTCFACHSYVRREKLGKDKPGRVSWASPGR